MFVHASRISKQLEYLESLGISAEGVLKRINLTRIELQDPEKTLSIEQFIKVIEFTLSETRDPYYGLRMGQEPHLAGTIGMMCASCRNLKEAFVQGCRYFSVQGDFADIEFMEDRNYPRIRYTIARSWLLQSAITAMQEIDTMFSFLASILRINSNNRVKPFRVNLTHKKPDDPSRYTAALGVEPYFSQPENEMIFRNSDLKLPMKAFNPETFEVLKSHIDARLKRYSSETLVSEKVRSILLSSLQYDFPDMETVATRLNVSPRTLQRMLSSENTSYKELLQATRIDLAMQFLRQKSFSVSEISLILGYSDLGNFSRSFKKYTGMSPKEYRIRKNKKNK